MLIRTFRKSYLIQYILLALMHLILWGGAFISPAEVSLSGDPYLSPAYALLLKLLGNNPYLYVSLAFLLVLSAAIIFSYTIDKNNLADSNSLIPALVFIVVMSLFPGLQTLHQALIPGFIMIVVLDMVFDIFTAEEAYTKVFNSSFLVAVSSFFYFPSIAFLLFIWLTFFIYRLYSWREWVIVLLGFLTPYILLWTYFFWTDDLAKAFQAYQNYFTPKSLFNFAQGISILNYFSAGIVILLFIRAFLIQAAHLQENVISVRKRFWAVILFLVISLASFLFSGSLAALHVVFIQVSLALVIQGMMFKLRRLFFTELTLWVLILLILINNYVLSFQSF